MDNNSKTVRDRRNVATDHEYETGVDPSEKTLPQVTIVLIRKKMLRENRIFFNGNILGIILSLS